jgi:hypothetical protein
MKFARAVHNCPALAGALRPGLQALEAAERHHINCANPRRLAGSVDVDLALSQALPNEPRWDYAVGVKHDHATEVVIWIEVHPASSTGEVGNVIAKLNWLKSWSAANALDLKRLTRGYVWVTTGSVAFSASSPQRRQLAAAGVQFAGQRYEIRA